MNWRARVAWLAFLGGAGLASSCLAQVLDTSTYWECQTNGHPGGHANTQAQALQQWLDLFDGAYLSAGPCGELGTPDYSACPLKYGPNQPSGPAGNAGVYLVCPGNATQTISPDGITCPWYFVSLDPSPQTDCGCTPLVLLFDPISPASGNVTLTENDIAPIGSSGDLRLQFSRFYNSSDSTPTDLSPGWRRSYSRNIAPQTGTTVYTPYFEDSSRNSALWSDPSDACIGGWPQIRPASYGNAAFTNGVCTATKPDGSTMVIPIRYAGRTLPPSSTVTGYIVTRDDGQVIRFSINGSQLTAPAGVAMTLTQTASGGFQLTDENDNVEIYDSSGRLLSITSRAGFSLTAAYDSGTGLLTTMTDSFGNAITLSYTIYPDVGIINLTTVTGPGSSAISYQYDLGHRFTGVTNTDGTTRTYTTGTTGFPNALVALNDETGTQYSTWSYDSDGRAIATSEAGGANAASLAYNSDGSVTTTDALGEVRKLTFVNVGDRNVSSSVGSGPCPGCGAAASTTYDSAGFVSSRQDYNGNLTCYLNDDTRELELVRLEGLPPGSTCPANLASYTPASGSVQRKISTTWQSNFRLPATITEFNRLTSFSYDSSGNLQTLSIADTSVTPAVQRTWTYTDDTFGRVLTATGPRTDVSDVTTYTYYTCSSGGQCGQLKTVTDAVGNVTTYNTYNAYGQPLTITDPNGVVTTLTYDARQRPLTWAKGGETTSVTYYPTGDVETVTAPDSSTLRFTYDGAHRLTKIQDGLGNSIVYTLDAAGNRTSATAYDPSGVLSSTRSQVFNALSELSQQVGSAGTAAVTTTYTYDGNGTRTTAVAPLNRNTSWAYDPLNRLAQVTDPAGGTTLLSYDAHDQLTAVMDPNGQTTGYQLNTLGDLLQVNSPATGISSYTYDSGGNVASQTDARGVGGTFTYDADNRITRASYGDQTITYSYDLGSYGKGHLTGASDLNHTLAWQYDGLGRVTTKSQTVSGVTLSVGYGYLNGLLTTLTTPSGQSVVYGYTNHRITSVSINGNPLLSGVTYEAFGPVRGWSWANGTNEIRLHDTDGNPSQISGVESVSYTLDNAFRIVSAANASNGALSQVYDYDSLDRLSDYTQSAGAVSWTYDRNGNRLSQSGGSAPAYAAPSLSMTYNNRGRMSSSQAGSTTTQYIYDAMGQRIEKSGASVVLYSYDEAGHLLGEYAGNGALIQETVWMGDLPIATLRPDPAGGIDVFYIHTDHLGTPRMVSRPSDNAILWRWDPDPFGIAGPNQNPSGIGTFVYNVRRPGQYFDAETGLDSNYFRDFDPAIGRYVESDPIGLAGGLNTYAYVGGNPIGFTDSFGLSKTDRWFGFNNRDFQWWFHNCYKQKGDPDVASREDMADAYAEYLAAGSPPRGKCSNNQPKSCPVPQPAPAPAPDPADDNNTAKSISALAILYWVLSEGSRLFPPRNLIPVP